jgi:hypothetical protein
MSELARGILDDNPAAIAIPLVLRIALIVALAGLLNRLLARQPAAARHAIWLCATVIGSEP